MNRQQNNYFKNIADETIAHGALTNSKRPSCFVQGVYPTHIKKGFKCYLVDVDNNQYVDFICGLGTNFFGYSNPDISEAVREVIYNGGPSFSLSTDYECEYAQTFINLFPFIDKVRFLKTGTEGCMAAIKIARAFTGRKWIISDGYHGWSDHFIGLTPPAYGVSPDPYVARSEEALKPSDIAAYIIEPIITDHSFERIKYLQRLREFCDKHKILLIYDETITAFRFPKYCAASHYNIYPDLWIGGKAVAGGYPLSVVGGRRDVMDSDYFVSGTWAGDRISLAAATKALDLIHGPYDPIELWTKGLDFLSGFNAISPEVQIVGYPTRGVMKYKTPQFQAAFMQEMCLAGVLFGPSWFYNRWLDEEKDNVLSLVKSVVRKILRGHITLKGEMPKSPFAERFRNAR